MKLLLPLVVIAFAAPAFAQCDPSISVDTRMWEIREKLHCLSGVQNDYNDLKHKLDCKSIDGKRWVLKEIDGAAQPGAFTYELHQAGCLVTGTSQPSPNTHTVKLHVVGSRAVGYVIRVISDCTAIFGYDVDIVDSSHFTVTNSGSGRTTTTCTTPEPLTQILKFEKQ